MQIIYKPDKIISSNHVYYLVYDVGGTNCNVGLFKIATDGVEPYEIIRFKVADYDNFLQLCLESHSFFYKQYYDIKICTVLIAAAGPVDRSAQNIRITMSNLAWTIEYNDVAEIFPKPINVILCNDFEIIWYGINQMNPRDIHCIHKGIALDCTTFGIIGAGTGLGKSIVVKNSSDTIIVPSEGGHQGALLIGSEEYAFSECICNKEKLEYLSWEQILSGKGIARIYEYLYSQMHAALDDTFHIPHPDYIFNNRFNDAVYMKTYEWYTRFYARCIREFMLDILPYGGIYIAGGIAVHNIELFKSDIFLHEMLSHRRFSDILHQIPVYVIGDYNVSLYGGAEYIRLYYQYCINSK